MATKTGGFDAEIFKKLVALFDSSNAGEAENAFRKAVLMCAKYGLRWREAIAAAFGQNDERAAQLEAENAGLREELERRKEDGDELADALERAQEKLAARDRQGEPGGRVWSPRILLLVLVGVIVTRIGLYKGLGVGRPIGSYHAATAFGTWLANAVFVVAGLWLLAKWNHAQYRADGWRQLVMKWTVLGAGLGLAALLFFNGPPWEAHGYYSGAPVPALVVAVLTVLLVISKFTERLIEKMSATIASFSMRRAVSWITGWFV
jgi:hypothetical protein